MKLAFQIVTPQELHGPLGRLGSAARKQIERSGERVVRRIAHLDPLGTRGTTACEQRSDAQSNGGAWQRMLRIVREVQAHGPWRLEPAGRAPAKPGREA